MMVCGSDVINMAGSLVKREKCTRLYLSTFQDSGFIVVGFFWGVYFFFFFFFFFFGGGGGGGFFLFGNIFVNFHQNLKFWTLLHRQYVASSHVAG